MELDRTCEPIWVLVCSFVTFWGNVDAGPFVDMACGSLLPFMRNTIMDVQLDFTRVKVIAINLEKGSSSDKMVLI